MLEIERILDEDIESFLRREYGKNENGKNVFEMNWWKNHPENLYTSYLHFVR